MIHDYQINQSTSNNNVVIDLQSQPTVSSVEYSSGPRETVTYVRNEYVQDYEFRAKGKYTSQILNKHPVHEFSKRGSVVAGGMEFNFDSTEANYCNTHNEIKDYILFSKIDGYRIFDTICKNCLSQINYRNPNPAKAELFDTVILDNKEKILQIRQNKLQLGGGNTSDTLNILKETILPLADELIYLSEVFDHEVCGKINGNFARAEEIAKLKSFINSIELTPNGDPNVFGIGKNEPLKQKYIKLALFLVHFNGLNNDNVNHNGLAESLKSHMVKIIALRKTIIARITTWLKYLSGGFYDYTFDIEGIPVDEVFRRNLQIDYVSEEDILKLKIFFEAEIKKRDDRIRLLEEENTRYKREIEALRCNLIHMNEQEALIADLKMKLQKLEAEYNYQKQTITTITTENGRLNGLNAEYLSQIDVFRREIAQLKIDFEAKLRSTLDSMRNEYEKKINEYIININQWKSKYTEFEGKYTIEIRNYSTEREQLQNQIKLWNQRYDNDVKSLSLQIENLTVEYNNLNITIKNQLVTINSLTISKEDLEKTVEGLRLHIKSLENELNSASSNIQLLYKEREEARNQIIILKGDLDKCRGEITVITNIKVTYENRINELQKKIEELSSLYAKLHSEYNLKLTIIANLEKKIEEMDGVVSSSEGEIDMYITKIQKYEEEMTRLNKEINELRVKLLVITEKDAEITRLKLALSACRDEWTKLSESYEGLLVDIKNQIAINEALRMFIYELQSKIESHNQQVGGLDAAIRQQLEILTRQTLSKKSIEYNQNNDAVRKSQSEIDALRTKLGRIESSKLTKSAVFSNISLTMDSVSTKSVNSNTNSNNNSSTSQFVKYYVENNNLNQSISQNNSNNVVISNSNNNPNNTYRTTTTYEQKYTTPTNYNYRNTYDRTYGANVFNQAYGGSANNVNSSSMANVSKEVDLRKTGDQTNERNTTVEEVTTEFREVTLGGERRD